MLPPMSTIDTSLQQLRQKSIGELRQVERDCRVDIATSVIAGRQGKLSNTNVARALRRQLARILTVIREKR